MSPLEKDFLRRLHEAGGMLRRSDRAMPHANREQDKARQRLRRAGLIEWVDGCWWVTIAGRAALEAEKERGT